MDVGLNNRNTLGNIAPEFADVVFFVEATSCEYFNIWQDYSPKSKSNIPQIDESYIEAVGMLLPGTAEILTEHNQSTKHLSEGRAESWEEISSGFSLCLGYLDEENNDKSVYVSFRFAIINGKKVCFYNATSRFVDHEMINKWLITRFQLTHDGYTRWNHSDATNFHNCIQSLDNLDVEPRDSVYHGEHA